jgi:hypothetical protein
MTDSKTNEVVVEQCDRDAAAATGPVGLGRSEWLRLAADFARHRLTASEPLLAQAKREAFEEAAKVAELHIPERNLSVSDLSARATARTIADNIRALAQSEGEGKA